MSYDTYVCDEPYYENITPPPLPPPPPPPPPNMMSQDFMTNMFNNDPLSDSSLDTFLLEMSSNHLNQNPNTTQYQPQISPNQVQSLENIANTLLSNSPPSQLLETLSLSNLTNSCDYLNNNNSNYCVNDVKTEEFSYNHSLFINNNNNNGGFSNSYNVGDHCCLDKFMQRSYSSSSNSFDDKNNNFLYQSRFEPVLNVQNVADFGSSDMDSAQMRRVCSTGDLLVNSPEGMNQIGQQSMYSSNGAFGGEGNVIDDGHFKVGKYSAEERKERIDRYKAKRTQRNFNKTIKYACRKTLADNRPRIRGRFARNDEPGENPNSKQDDDDLWVDNLQEEEEGIRLGGGGQRGRLVSNMRGIHFQYYGYY